MLSRLEILTRSRLYLGLWRSVPKEGTVLCNNGWEGNLGLLRFTRGKGCP